MPRISALPLPVSRWSLTAAGCMACASGVLFRSVGAVAREQRLDGRMGRQFTVLLVEDDSEVRSVVQQMLVARNFRVLVASDGYEAIRLLIDQHVDVMFTDIVMPGVSGYELAAQAK